MKKSYYMINKRACVKMKELEDSSWLPSDISSELKTTKNMTETIYNVASESNNDSDGTSNLSVSSQNLAQNHIYSGIENNIPDFLQTVNEIIMATMMVMILSKKRRS